MMVIFSFFLSLNYSCDHLRVFEADQPYHRFTEKNYFSTAEGSVHETISSRIVLQHCMSNSSFQQGKKFKLKYEVIGT